jgi:hypothetical protein
VVGDNINIIYVIGQAIGIIAFFLTLTEYFQKKKENIMKIAIFAYLIFMVHYIMIGAFTGSYSRFIALGRDSYIYAREKHHKKHRHRLLYNNFLVFVFFVVVYSTCIFFERGTPLNMLPLFSGLIYFIFEWFGNKVQTKIAGGATTVLWLIYNIANFSIFGICTDILGITASILGTTRDIKRRKNSKRKK